jgi:ATP-dependent Clp protease protease subunit
VGVPRGFEPVGPEVLREQLFQQRIVQLRGPLDDASAGRAAAELMALDALGDSSVQLYLDSSGGALSSAFTLIDTIDLLGVPVHVTCVGRVEGTAVGVLVAGERRTAAPHARFHLVEPTWSGEGNATELVGWVEHHQAELASFVRRIAEATGRPAEHLEADMALGRWMDAEEAVAYGLVHEIWKPKRGKGTEGGARRPLGFSPPN